MSAIERMDPARGLDTAEPGLATALDGLGAAIAASPRPEARARRRRFRIGFAGIAVAAVLATAGTATAGWLSIHTGLFGEPGMTENDTSEFLRTDGAEMPALFDSIARRYTLPPGGSWEAAKRRFVGGEPGLIQRAGVEQAVAFESICQWTGAWLDGRRGAATHVLTRVPGWPVIADHDGGGTVESFQRLAAAARDGDADPVRQYRRANCA
jgi:hypothetical protein